MKDKNLYWCSKCHREKEVKKKMVMVICPGCMIEMDEVVDGKR